MKGKKIITNLLRLLKVAVLFILPVVFGGCPHQLAKELDILIPPKNYKPVYLTSTVPIAFSDINKLAVIDSNNLPLDIRIRKINDKMYPDSIEIMAVVYDTSGRYIAGLAPPYLKGPHGFREYWVGLNDSCKSGRHDIITYDVREIREDESMPYAVSFVLDHSSSMGDKKVKRLQQAVRIILNSIKGGDWISVIKFASNQLVDVPITSVKNEYKQAFRRKSEEKIIPGTKIYDAGAKSIEELNKAPSGYQKTMILFTDGLDGGSSVSLDSFLIMAKSNDITVYTVSYGIGMANFEPLKKIAEYTGGKHYHLFSTKEFPYVFADIYLTMNNYYRITYRPPDCKSVHRANVTLEIPGTRLPPVSAAGYYDRSVFVKHAPVGTITFLNIEFESGKANIKEDSYKLLEEVAEAMKENKNLEIRICGHTDDVGSEKDNMQLSEERARSVYKALIKMGIDKDRLKTVGYGESRPLVPNDSEENRKKNRRTEFVVIKN